MIKKIWNLEQMRKRLENLKKVIHPPLVDTYIAVKKAVADNELDALYLAYYQLKGLSLRYNRATFGQVNDVNYKPKFDWESYLKEYDRYKWDNQVTQPARGYVSNVNSVGYSYDSSYSYNMIFVDYDSYYR